MWDSDNLEMSKVFVGRSKKAEDQDVAIVGPSLKSRVFRAGSWSLIGHVVGQALRLGSNLVLTRLLVPEMFGVMSIVTVIVIVVALLSDVGIRQAIFQSQRGQDPIFLNTAWTVQVIRGWLIWSVCLLVALLLHLAGGSEWLPAHSVYSADVLPIILAVSTFSAVITGFQSTKLISTNRDLDMKRITLIELITQFIGLVVMGILAWVTRSIWALVVGGLISSVITVVLSHFWLPGIENRFQWDKSALKELVGFGRWIVLSSALFVVAVNGDRLLLGAWFSADTLGIYSIAINLATVIENGAYRIFGTVSLPVLSEVARTEPQRFRALYFKMRLPGDLVFIGAAGFLFASGQMVIDLLYDHRYGAAGQMLQILSFGLLFTRFNLAHNAYVAMGVPSHQTAINLVRIISMFVLVPALYHFAGMYGALVGIAIHVAPTLILVFWFNARHGLNNFKFELFVLTAWPFGYLLGWLITKAVAP